MIPEVKSKLGTLETIEFVANFSSGYDNAGNMPHANQKSRNDLCQDKRESAHIVLRNIEIKDGDEIYDNPYKNSCHGMRPWAQLAMKENRETLNKMHEEFMESETEVANTNVFKVYGVNGKTISFTVVIKPWIIDGKIVKESLGIGGAWCTKCTASQKDGHNIDCVLAGFRIDRDAEQIAELAEELADEEGNIRR